MSAGDTLSESEQDVNDALIAALGDEIERLLVSQDPWTFRCEPRRAQVVRPTPALTANTAASVRRLMPSFISMLET